MNAEKSGEWCRMCIIYSINFIDIVLMLIEILMYFHNLPVPRCATDKKLPMEEVARNPPVKIRRAKRKVIINWVFLVCITLIMLSCNIHSSADDSG